MVQEVMISSQQRNVPEVAQVCTLRQPLYYLDSTSSPFSVFGYARCHLYSLLARSYKFCTRLCVSTKAFGISPADQIKIGRSCVRDSL